MVVTAGRTCDGVQWAKVRQAADLVRSGRSLRPGVTVPQTSAGLRPRTPASDQQGGCRKRHRQRGAAQACGSHFAEVSPYLEFQLQTSALPARLRKPNSQSHQEPSDS